MWAWYSNMHFLKFQKNDWSYHQIYDTTHIARTHNKGAQTQCTGGGSWIQSGLQIPNFDFPVERGNDRVWVWDIKQVDRCNPCNRQTVLWMCVYVPIICSAHNPLVIESDAADQLFVTLQNPQTSAALNVPQPTNRRHGNKSGLTWKLKTS